MQLNQRLKVPRYAYERCPACGSADLIPFDELNIFCGNCIWDSCAEFVEAGGMDYLIHEYEDMLQKEKDEIKKDKEDDQGDEDDADDWDEVA